MNPNDRIREQILQYLYDRNAAATSRTGKKGSGVKISDVKRELKERHGLKQPQVMSNLTYLIDNEWVKTFDIQKTVTVRRGTVPSTTTFYLPSQKAILSTGQDRSAPRLMRSGPVCSRSFAGGYRAGRPLHPAPRSTRPPADRGAPQSPQPRLADRLQRSPAVGPSSNVPAEDVEAGQVRGLFRTLTRSPTFTGLDHSATLARDTWVTTF